MSAAATTAILARAGGAGKERGPGGPLTAGPPGRWLRYWLGPLPGRMFWLMWKVLSGSYRCLIWVSRW